MAITATILLVAVVSFVWNAVPAAITALGVALALFLTGTVTFAQAIAGFGDPIVIYLAGLFVVSEALDATGLTAWIGQLIGARVGGSRTSIVVALMLLSAALTALISVNGAIAALVPVAVIMATRARIAPSQIQLPLAFAAHAGSMLTMLGTPINVLVSEFAVDAGARPFGFLEFALVGVPLVIGVVALAVFLGPRVLPERTADGAPRDFSAHAATLAREYAIDESATALGAADGVTEFVIPPRSPFLGDHVYPGMLTDDGDLIVVAVRRADRPVEHADLRVGDVILLRGTWDALERRAGAGVLPVDDPDRVRRQPARPGARAVAAGAVLVLMCAALALDLQPPAIVVLVAAAALVALRVITMAQAERSISLPTLLVVAGMLPMSTAIQSSGIADAVSRTLVERLGGGSPVLLLAGIVVTVLAMGQFISNLATVLIVAPIAVSVAETAHVSPLPMLMAITVAGAAAFLTPVATTGNLMVQDPGGYRFGDFWRLGLPCMVLFAAVAIGLVPLIWPF